MDITSQLNEIKEEILNGGYEDSVKEQLTALIDQVTKEPSSENLKALSAVLEALSDSEKYLGAQEILGSDKPAKPGEKLLALKNLLDIAVGSPS